MRRWLDNSRAKCTGAVVAVWAFPFRICPMSISLACTGWPGEIRGWGIHELPMLWCSDVSKKKCRFATLLSRRRAHPMLLQWHPPRHPPRKFKLWKILQFSQCCSFLNSANLLASWDMAAAIEPHLFILSFLSLFSKWPSIPLGFYFEPLRNPPSLVKVYPRRQAHSISHARLADETSFTSIPG